MRPLYLKTEKSNELDIRLGLLFYSTLSKGIVGYISKEPESFFVEEDSHIKEDENGQHLLVKVKKINLTSYEVAKILAKVFGVNVKSIGFAGNKDKNAVAIQYFSVPHQEDWEEKLNKLKEFEVIEILEVKRIGRKIRPGMLLGNNFTIKLKLLEGSYSEIREIINELEEKGCPNFYGYQKFGTVRPNTHLLGKYLVKRDYDSFLDELLFKVYEKESEAAKEVRNLASEGKYLKAFKKFPRSFFLEKLACKLLSRNLPKKRVVVSLGKRWLNFFVGAYQAYLFNLMVSERMSRNLPLNQKIDGDFVKAKKPAFPLVGYKSKLPQGVAGEIVKEVLEKETLSLQDFKLSEFKLKMKGSLREIPMSYRNLKIDLQEEMATFKFWLKKGSYATVLIREFTKSCPYEGCS